MKQVLQDRSGTTVVREVPAPACAPQDRARARHHHHGLFAARSRRTQQAGGPRLSMKRFPSIVRGQSCSSTQTTSWCLISP